MEHIRLGAEWRDTTVSHGTMLARDLIPAFADMLPASDPLKERATREFLLAFEDGTEDGLDDLVNELFDALDEIAPEGCYFGAHPGDGSDYGFWAIDEDVQS